MDLTTLVGLLGQTPESEKARPILDHFPSLRATVSGFSSGTEVLTETFLSCRDHGFEARLAATGEIITIYLMGAGNEGFEEFPYPLVEGLRFGARRDAVEAKFGKPHWSRSTMDTPIVLHGVGHTIRYDLRACTLYFQFNWQSGLLQEVAAESIIGFPAHYF